MMQNLTFVFVKTDWLQETLPKNCFDKNGTKLITPLEFAMNSILEGRTSMKVIPFSLIDLFLYWRKKSIQE